MRINVRRYLHLSHRWLGIVFGVLVLLWFVSGLVMLYIPYPSLTSAERLSHLSPIVTQNIKYSVANVWKQKNGIQPELVKLSMLNNRPVYHILSDKKWQSVWADNGQKLFVNQPLIYASVKSFNATAHIENIAIMQIDQWSLSNKYNAHRPLYLAELNDSFGTHLYLSSKTGEVIIDTTRQERAWNWVGAVIHWIYFTPLRVQADAWRQVILWTSFFSMILVGIGFWLGLNRLRVKNRYKNNRITPYTGWKKWHHLIGIAGGIFCMTWLLSGWLSVKPFNWISERKLTDQENAQWAGKNLNVNDMSLPATFKSNQNFKEINWLNFSGNTYILGRDENRDWLMDKQTVQALKPFSHNKLMKQASLLQNKQTIHSVELLNQGDLYYRANSNKQILPVLRIQFNDSNQTAYYVDKQTSNILASYDNQSRIYRWLFHALHRLDISPLADIELSRQLVIIALSTLGIVLTFTGVIIGMQRLRH